MAGERRPILVVLAGPNGAGKTTLYQTRIAPSLSVPFINADIIQQDELGDPEPQAAYEAARMAEERRRQFLKERRSFATESVFSHPSKLELIEAARQNGFRIMLFHVSTASPDLSVARVGERVREGGHRVPEDKIRARYARNGPIIRQAALISDIAHVFDNSALNTPPRPIISFNNGHLAFVDPDLPEWALEIYGNDLAEA